MSDDKPQASRMPFTPPPMMAPPSTPNMKGKGPKTPISNKKQLKNAKKNRKSSINVRGLIAGVFILVVTSLAVTAVTSPDTLARISAGEIIERTETCLVTETNASLYFDTDCGKFVWNEDRQPGTPKTKLVEGQTYNIKSSGFRFGMAKVFPSVVGYEQVTQ